MQPCEQDAGRASTSLAAVWLAMASSAVCVGACDGVHMSDTPVVCARSKPLEALAVATAKVCGFRCNPRQHPAGTPG